MCSTLSVHRSGFYAWLKEPKSQRQKDDEYLLGFIKQFWLESGCVYGYRKIYKDMQAAGERICRKIYSTREAGKNDIFNYIEMFYNPFRRHGNNDDLSPADYEGNYFMKQTSV